MAATEVAARAEASVRRGKGRAAGEAGEQEADSGLVQDGGTSEQRGQLCRASVGSCMCSDGDIPGEVHV